MKKVLEKKAGTVSVFKSPETKKLMKDPGFRVMVDEKKELLKIAEEIGKKRKEQSISQSKLSHITKIPQEELSRIERGKRNITLETYFRIIRGLGYEAEIKYHRTHDAHA
jgi:predicted transcriptional regulator